jgi:hypothetical protein
MWHNWPECQRLCLRFRLGPGFHHRFRTRIHQPFLKRFLKLAVLG